MDSRSGTQTLSCDPVPIDATEREACPRCEEPAGPVPGARVGCLDNVPIRRCARCATRFTEERPPRLVFSCAACGLPHVAEGSPPQPEQRCTDCRDGRVPADLSGARFAAAAENEIRLALDKAWVFVTSSGLRAYLDRLAGQLASHISGAPEKVHVVLVDQPEMLTLALPSGLLLISLGTLDGLENEAELAFVLGHELAHAACGDAALRLVRLGLDGVARDGRSNRGTAWIQAARDLVSLGYGRRRERDADARALEAMAALGYESGAVLRYLSRLAARVRQGDPHLRALALAHPPATERRRHVQRVVHGHVAAGTGRINREVFRRAAGPQARSHGLERVTLGAADPGLAEPAGAVGARWLWTAAAVALLATLILIVGLALAG